MSGNEEKSIILMNQMFVGGYLNEGSNVGHEVVNLLKDDHGDNYLYITPNGKVSLAKRVQSVIFVRNFFKKKVVEVIAIAPRVSVFSGDISNIKYGGVSLKTIFAENIWNGESEADEDASVLTFRADDGVFVPTGRVLLETVGVDACEKPEYPIDAKVFKIQSDKSVINTSMRAYFDSSKAEEKAAFEGLNDLVVDCVSDLRNWRKVNGSVDASDSFKSSDSFLEIIKKENDELVFSNLLKYYFEKNRDGFRKFAREKLGIADMEQDFVVEREKSFIPKSKSGGEDDSEPKKRRGVKFIDLWIEDEQHIIVIENKIKSGINGIDETGSQLEYYYDFAKGMAEGRDGGSHKKTTHFFVLAPQYNMINLHSYPRGPEYYPVTYNDLYDFFSENSNLYQDDRYFGDFLKGLERHTKTMSELNQDVMNVRFAERIRIAAARSE